MSDSDPGCVKTQKWPFHWANYMQSTRRAFDFRAARARRIVKGSHTRPMRKLSREFSHSLGREQTSLAGRAIYAVSVGH